MACTIDDPIIIVAYMYNWWPNYYSGMYNWWPIVSLTSWYSGPDGQENCSVSFEGARRVNEKQWWVECEESGKSVTVYRNWIISVCTNELYAPIFEDVLHLRMPLQLSMHLKGRYAYNRISKALGMSCLFFKDANCCMCIVYVCMYIDIIIRILLEWDYVLQ